MDIFLSAEKWQSIIENVANVLRINLCIVDAAGVPVAIPALNRYGWKFLPQYSAVESNFRNMGDGRFEFIDNYRMHHYAIACISLNGKIKGHIILGPMILNKRLEKNEYQGIATSCGDNFEKLIERVEEIRILSHLNLDYMLNAIAAFVNIGQDQLRPTEASPNQTQNILHSMLELSLAIANAESGSVMLYNAETDELSIRAVKGLDPTYLNSTIKPRQGISGIAFLENRTMIIKGQTQSKDIQALLKRSEIQQSMVMPFETSDKKTRGVLNINIISPEPSSTSPLESLNGVLAQIVSNVLCAI